jgi:hypothetical protein
MKTLVLGIKPSLKSKKNCIEPQVLRDTKLSQPKSHAFKCGLLLPPESQGLKQFAIRNSQFAITFWDGDLDPDPKRAACLAGDLNPQSSLTVLVNVQVSTLENFHTVTRLSTTPQFRFFDYVPFTSSAKSYN